MLDNIATIIIISLIFILFFFYLLRERALTKSYLKQLKTYQKFSEKLSSETLDCSVVNDSREKLIMRYFIVNQEGLATKDKYGQYSLTTPVAAILPEQPTSPHRFIPALLTSVGVLGTFYGISIGLMGLSIENADSKALMSSAFSLIGGMETAFYTSLAGMACSILFMIFLSWYLHKRSSQHKKIKDLFSQHCIELSPITLLQNLTSHSQDDLVEKQLRAFGAITESNRRTSQVVTSFQDVINDLSSDKLSQSLAAAVKEAIKEEVVPPLDALPQIIQELKEIKQDQGELIINAIQKEIVAPVLMEMTQVSESLKSSTSTNQVLTVKLSQLAVVLESTTMSLNEFQRDTLDKLTDFATDLKDILNQFKVDTNSVLKDVAHEINQALASAIEGMKSQREAFESSTASATLAFNEQNKSLKNIGDEASRVMIEAGINLNTGLGEIDEKVKSMSLVVQSELESFRLEYQGNLKEFFSQQEILLDETLGQQRDGLVEVVSKYKAAFMQENELRESQYEAIAKQSERLQEGVLLVEQLVSAVGLNKAASFDQLQDVARSTATQVSALKREYAQASQKFSDMTEQLPKAMGEYFDTAEKSHEEFFQSFDDAAAKVHGRLAEAANLLVTAMQTLQIQNQNALEEV